MIFGPTTSKRTWFHFFGLRMRLFVLFIPLVQPAVKKEPHEFTRLPTPHPSARGFAQLEKELKPALPCGTKLIRRTFAFLLGFSTAKVNPAVVLAVLVD